VGRSVGTNSNSTVQRRSDQIRIEVLYSECDMSCGRDRS
jgi:hypothetical protein